MWQSSQRYERPAEAYDEMRERVDHAMAVPDPKEEIESHPRKDWLRAR